MQETQDKRPEAEKIARKAAGDALPEDARVLVDDRENHWRFTFLPQGRVRGGGVSVTVFKDTMEVTEIVRLQ